MSENWKPNEIEKVIYARLREFGKSFWLIDFRPWVHPENKVLNCMAITSDGFIQYKFQFKSGKRNGQKVFLYKVAEIKNTWSIDLGVKVGQTLDLAELITAIQQAKIGGIK